MSHDPVKDYADELGLIVDEFFDEIDSMIDDDLGLPGQQEEA